MSWCSCRGIERSAQEFGTTFEDMTPRRKAKTIGASVAIGAGTALAVGLILGLAVSGRLGIGIGLLGGTLAGTVAFVVLVKKHDAPTQASDKIEETAEKARRGWNNLWR